MQSNLDQIQENIIKTFAMVQKSKPNPIAYYRLELYTGTTIRKCQICLIYHEVEYGQIYQLVQYDFHDIVSEMYHNTHIVSSEPISRSVTHIWQLLKSFVSLMLRHSSQKQFTLFGNKQRKGQERVSTSYKRFLYRITNLVSF